MDLLIKVQKGLMFGRSMKPTMGIVNFVWGSKPESVAVGDVIGFYRKNRWWGERRIIHRVIDIDSNGNIYIKGDNSPEVDCVTLSKIFFKLEGFKKIW